jgi:hypothetical protein
VRVAIALVGALGVWAAANTAPLRDSASGVTFEPAPKVGGTTFECLGAGVRKVLVFEAYALTFCLDARQADSIVDGYVASAHPGLTGEALAKALREDGGFYRQLAQEPADRLVVMKALRDLSRDQLAGAFKDSLSKVLPPASVAKLIAAIPGDAPKGAEITLRSHGDALTIDIAGNARTVEDADVAHHIWDVWLSKDTVSSSLKKSIAERTAMRVMRPGGSG